MPDEPQGVAGAAIDAGKTVLTALPAQFLALCLLNAAFLAMTMWFWTAQLDQRTAIVTKIIDGCMVRVQPHP